ncbi:MAG: carotenoid biosynthesis protein [Pyrinomonadaceae bacterium]|nr:carotenoid biosynthesis protein [Pyrinomonadaceae bacterium]
MLQKNKNLFLAIIISVFLMIGAFFMVNVPLVAEYSTISAINVVLFAVPSFWALWRWIGLKYTLIFIVALGIYALTIETIGLTTGFPYGEFFYNDLLGSRLFGVTPWTVAFAWTPLILASLSVANRTVNSRLKRVLLMTILLVLIDLVLDPGAVHLNFWKYSAGGIYYNVPFSNFAGWVLSGAIGAIICEILLTFAKPKFPAPVQLTISCFYILLFWTALNALAVLFIPALIGIILLIGFGVFYYSFYEKLD